MPQPAAAKAAAGSGGSPINTPMPDAGTAVVALAEEIAIPEPTGAALLDRASSADYRCSIARPFSALSVGAAAQPVSLAGSVHLFWVEGGMPGKQPTGPLEMARLGSDGVLQPATSVFTPRSGTFVSAQGPAAAGHDRIALWWSFRSVDEPVLLPGPPSTLMPVEGPDRNSGFVQLDAAGMPLAAARPFDPRAFAFDAKLVATSTGYLAVSAKRTATSCTLVLSQLDMNAELVGKRMELASLAVKAPPGSVFQCGLIDAVATPTGVALVYARSEGEREVRGYQAFSADGKALARASLLSPRNTHPLDASLIVQGDDVLAAWVVGVGPNNSVGQVESTLRVARLGADGELKGEVATLSAARAGQYDRKPLWVDLGDALGLAWSREQEVDPSCTEACQVAGTVKYAVLDMDTLSPRTAALEVAANDENTEGFTASLLARDADDLLVMIDHWGQEPFTGAAWTRNAENPGSATIHCDSR